MKTCNRCKQGWLPALAALLAGALLPLAFAPFGLFPLALLSPALLFVLLTGLSLRRAAWRGFLFGLGHFGVGVSWVYVAIHDFGYTGVFLASLMTVGFVAALALYPAALGALAGWLWQRGAGRGAALWYLLVLPALWLLVEWWRGWFLTGFPWLNLGNSQVDSPLAGWAPLLGVYGLSLAVALSAGALVFAWAAGPKRGPAVAVLLLVLLWGGGALLGPVAWTEPAGAPLKVSLVQGNQPQITKWDPATIQRRLDTYADLTRQRLGWADLVVWPENAITLFYYELKADYFDPLQREAVAGGTDLVVGLPRQTEDALGYYTSLMVLGREAGIYHKHHLVPFGEYLPLEWLRGLIRFFDLPMSGFSPGPAEQPPLPVAGQYAAASICYEDAFGAELRHNFPRATLLINGSNNAWYGDSLAPHQHLQISRLRALETGRPLLRVTTNGISALIDHHGKILQRTPQFETAVIDGSIQPMSGTTPYIQWGNWPVLVWVWAVVGFVLWRAGVPTPRKD